MLYHNSVRVKERCYCYIWQGRGNNCNTVLLPSVLRGEKPHVLVDPGHISNELGEHCFDSLTEAMEKDGFAMNDVGLLIGTHSHPDHIEASELVLEKNTALLTLSHEEDVFYSTEGKMLFQAFGMKPPPIYPSFYLKEGNLSLGAKEKVSIQVLLTPGHSPGSICLYLEEQKIMVSGDVVFAGSVGRTDFPGGSPSLLRQSIDRLSQFDIDYLIPGHSTEMGNIIAGKDKVKHNFFTIKMFI